jgi:hypothetical protein
LEFFIPSAANDFIPGWFESHHGVFFTVQKKAPRLSFAWGQCIAAQFPADLLEHSTPVPKEKAA